MKILDQALAAIHIHNPGDTLGEATATKAGKLIAGIGPRAVSFVSHAGVAISPSKPSDEFLDYLEGLYGWRPRVYSPTPGYPGHGRVDLVQMMAQDRLGLLKELSRLGLPIQAYMPTAEVFGLGKKAGLQVLGTPEGRLDVVRFSGNKALLKGVIEGLGLLPHEGQLATSWDQLLKMTQESLDTSGRVFLRHATGDGGEGNKTLKSTEVYGRPLSEVLKSLGVEEDWCVDGVLVETWHNVTESPAILVYIDDDGPHILQVHLQVIAGGNHCVGILRHNDPVQLFGDSDLVDRLTQTAMKIATWMYEQGFRGFASIDTIVCDEGEGAKKTLRVSEINPRMTSACLGLFAGKHLGVLGDRVLINNDQIFLAAGTTLGDVIKVLMDYGVIYNQETRRGVVITIEPVDVGGGEIRMGLLYIGENSLEAQYYSDIISEKLDISTHH